MTRPGNCPTTRNGTSSGPEPPWAAYGATTGTRAIYLATYTDSGGQPLDGSHSYTLRLSPTPPVQAFWSLTMYDVPSYYLVDNPIGRYSIGDRTPGLVSG